MASRSHCLGLLMTVAACSSGCSTTSRQDARAPSATQVTPFTADFETGDLSGWTSGEAAAIDRLQVVTTPEPVRSGRYALRVTLKPDDVAARRNRAEITRYNEDQEGSEGWYGWSFLIPVEYADVRVEERKFQIIGQWHDQPDRERGETWDNFPANPPPIAINYAIPDGVPTIGLNYGLGEKRRLVGQAEIGKGRWHDLLFRIRWSRGEDGFVQAWVDERPLTGGGPVYGPNMYSRMPNFLKLGLYRQSGINTTNVVYFDEVHIARSRDEIPRQ